MTSITRRPRMRLSKARLRVLRHQQVHKTCKARRDLYRNYQQLPAQARALFNPLAPAFSGPTYHRFVLRAVAAILTLGGHTICNLLRCLGALAPGHPSSYHRVFSRSPWNCWVSGLLVSERDYWCQSGIIGVRAGLLVSERDYWCQIIGVRLLVSDYWCQIIGVRLLVSDYWCQIIGVRLLVSDYWCRFFFRRKKNRHQ